ncbi:MAG: hypothetical protein HYU37_04320 [Acidobacteria bacterium]|nr:hypothetical protein [Acidobacteriota bacterium]
MDERAIREFVNRRWHEVAAAKTAFWAGRFAEDRQVSWRAAQALLQHVRRVQPAFPDDRGRDADLDGHLLLRARLDRAAHAFARR